MEKITKKQMFEGMVAYFRGEETEIAEEAFAQFCLAQIADLDKKSAKAKERAEEKRAAGSELRDAVQAILEGATEPLTRDMILAAFAAEDVEGMGFSVQISTT
mgnify:CR=1 FL=1